MTACMPTKYQIGLKPRAGRLRCCLKIFYQSPYISSSMTCTIIEELRLSPAHGIERHWQNI